MTLLSQITEDRKQAMRDKDEVKKIILNFVIAQIKYKKIEIKKDPEDWDIIQIIKKEVKALIESMWFLEKANKTKDLEEEKQKKAILELYLPQTMSREKTLEIIQKTITELNITDIRTQRWQVMKELMEKHKWEIDWSLVNEIINTL